MKSILIFILLLTTVACGQEKVKPEEPQIIEGWRKLEKPNYFIQYPSDWNVDESGQMGASFFILSPLESDKDNFKENINLMIQNLKGQNIDLDKFTEISEAQIKAMVTNSAMVESKRIKNSRGDFHKIIYSGDQGIYHLKFEQYYWLINDQAYVLTFTSEQDKFDDFLATGEKILNSFRILD